MKIRRYYRKGEKYGKTYTPEYLKELEDKGVLIDIIDNASFEIIFDKEEQKDHYQRCLNMVLENPRWVLDNLDNLIEFKVNWEDYHKRK